MVGSAELRKREHGNKTGGNFSLTFHFRVFPLSKNLEQATKFAAAAALSLIWRIMQSVENNTWPQSA